MTLAREASSETTFPVALRGYERSAVEIRLAQLNAERRSFEQHAATLAEQVAALASSRGEAPNHRSAGRNLYRILENAYDEANRLHSELEVEVREGRAAAEAAAAALREQAIEAAACAEASAREERERVLAQATEQAQTVRSQADAAAERLGSRARNLLEAATSEAARAAIDAGRQEAAAHASQEKRIATEQQRAADLAQAAGREARDQQEANAAIARRAEHEAKRLREAAAAAAQELAKQAEATERVLRQETDAAVAGLAAEVRGLIDQLSELHRGLTGRTAPNRRLQTSR